MLSLTGRVLDADTGAPVSECRLMFSRTSPDSISRPGGTPYICTNGAFSLELPRLGGAVRLKLEAEGYRPILTEPLPARSTNCVFHLKRGGGPAGVVESPDGVPLPQVEVCYLADRERASLKDGRLADVAGKSRLTDAGGRFSFAPKAGPGELIAACSNGFARVPLLSFDDIQNLRLQPWARVHGRLLDNGKPATGTKVTLMIDQPYKPDRPWLRLSADAITDADGGFAVEHVAPGPWQIGTVLTNGGFQAHRKFSVHPGENLDIGEMERTPNR